MIKKEDPLINVDSLREQIKKNSVRIIDVRRKEDYQQGHITNSVNLPLAKLLADASPENIVKIAEELGIGNETPVVVYDDTFGALSSRVVWALQYIGHENIKLLELKLDEDDDLRDSSIKISGCPNSCGQHEIATIGLYGGGARFGKDMYPNYVLSLGGRFDGQSMLGHHTARVPVKRVIPVILKIIELFKKYKQPDDSLSKWIDRIIHGNESSEIKSVEDIKKIIAPLLIPPTKEDDSDFYADYGSDTSYHTITGKGECAA